MAFDAYPKITIHVNQATVLMFFDRMQQGAINVLKWLCEMHACGLSAREYTSNTLNSILGPMETEHKSTARLIRALMGWVYLSSLMTILLLKDEVPTLMARETSGPPLASSRKELTPAAAAKLAASLANDECERLYKRRPFAAKWSGAVE